MPQLRYLFRLFQTCLFQAPMPKRIAALSLRFLLWGGLLSVLQACQSREGIIREGESTVITLSLEKGQFQTVTLDQLDCNLTMTLTTPSNKRMRVNYFDGTVGAEKLFWKAEETGAHKLTVSFASSKPGLTGHYGLTISKPQTVTDRDNDRWEAQRLYAEASQSYEELEPDDAAFEQKRDRVVKTYTDSISKWRTAGESALSAITLIHLGHLWYDQKKYATAKDFYEQALQEAQAATDLRGQADALANLGLISDQMSKTWENKQQAQRLFDRALGLSRQAKDRFVEASTLSNLGRYYRSIGYYQAALEHYLQALAAMRDLGDKEQEGLVLANLGTAYRSLGLKSEAEISYRLALEIQNNLGSKAEQARCHNGLGRVQDLLGERTATEKENARREFEQAVALGKNSSDRDVFEHNLGTICYELGMIHTRSGDAEKARELFGQSLKHLQVALELRQEVGRLHHTQASLGLLAHALGHKEDANRYLKDALATSREIRDEYQQAVVLAAQATVARDNRRLSEAKSLIEEALRIVESVAVRIVLPDLRSSYALAQRNFYDLHADILLRLQARLPSRGQNTGLIKLAWQQTERARIAAQQNSLDVLDLLSLQGIPLSQIKALRDLRQEILLFKPRPNALEDMVRLSKLTTKYQELEKQIVQQNPRAAEQLNLAVAADRLAKIQAALKQNTLLLEYSMGEDRGYLWVIAPTSFEVFTLPGQAQLGDDALQVGALILQNHAKPLSGSTKLSNWLLGPVASRLSNKNLIIVADGALGAIPFGALPEPTDPTRGESPEPRLLIETHEIVYAPAALSLLDRKEPTRIMANSVIAIADPVFNAEHPRAAHCKVERAPTTSHIAPTAPTELSAEGMKPVPFGKQEQDAFRRAVFGEQHSSRQELLGFQAKRDNVLNGKLAGYRNIVFYTHGVPNEREQGMTALALSRLNEQCVTGQYLLGLADIYNLKLSADLVTLIACNSARNQNVRGFGLSSIARGFMFAGARQVVGTLWEVEAEPSLALMTEFYRRQGPGVSAAEALRQAQLSFLQGHDLNRTAPRHWAGFVLMGTGD